MYECLVEVVWDNGIDGEGYTHIGNCKEDTVQSVKLILDKTYGCCDVVKISKRCYKFSNKIRSRKSIVCLSKVFDI